MLFFNWPLALKLIGLTDCKTNRTVILMESLECLKNLSVKDILDVSLIIIINS